MESSLRIKSKTLSVAHKLKCRGSSKPSYPTLGPSDMVLGVCCPLLVTDTPSSYFKSLSSLFPLLGTFLKLSACLSPSLHSSLNSSSPASQKSPSLTPSVQPLLYFFLNTVSTTNCYIFYFVIDLLLLGFPTAMASPHGQEFCSPLSPQQP